MDFSKKEIVLPLMLAKEEEIQEGKPLIVPLPGGIQIALFRFEGKIYALDNACPHMGGPLGEGEIEGDVVTCPWHGWQFNIKDGLNINGLGEDATTLKIKVEGGLVYLEQLPLNF